MEGRMEIVKNREKGIYLIIDPSWEENLLLPQIRQIVQEEIVAIQIWDNFKDEQQFLPLIDKICEISHAQHIPVIINNHWKLLECTRLDGVHFDSIPKNWNKIKDKFLEAHIIGLTCNNDLSDLKWAEKNQLNYVSFCSVFPSKTSNSCELVNFETIEKAKEQYSLPVFLAGGISHENLPLLSHLDFDGIAMVSGIMSAKKPQEAIQKYRTILNQ